MEFSKKTYNTIYGYLINIEQWCTETFKDKPKFLRRLPRQSGDETELRLGKKLNEFRNSSLYKKYKAEGKDNLDPEELYLIEKYEKIVKEYGHRDLNIQGQNLLDIEQWCRESFEDKPKYLRHTPAANCKEEDRRKEAILGQALSHFKTGSLFKRYLQFGKEDLNEAEKELIELYNQIMYAYDHASLNIQGQNLRNIELWCRTNFEDKPKYLRRVPCSSIKGDSSETENALGQLLEAFKKTDLFHQFLQSGKESLNEAETELIEIYEKIISEYNFRTFNSIGKNLIEIKTWCQKFGRLPRTVIKGVKVPTEKEGETDEQIELRLGTVWGNFKSTNKLYKKYRDNGKDSLNQAERELIEIFEQIQLEYGDTQKIPSKPIKVEYKGEYKSLFQIAKDEKIPLFTLKVYYKQTCNIYKSVFMCKINVQKSLQVPAKNGEVNLYDLSIILGIKYSELVNLLKKGLSIEDIKGQYASTPKPNQQIQSKREYKVLANGQTLLEYCVDNGLNYSYIYRAINTYGKTLEEATLEYRKKGSEMPNTWIFERYGLLLRHLLTSMSIDINTVVRYMRKDYISMSEALEKYIIRRNSKKLNLNGEWMEEVYAFLTDCNMSDQYDEFKKMFYIDEAEEECITQSFSEIDSLERKLLLFDIAEAIEKDVFSNEEVPQLLQMYEITPEEIETIFLDLYSKFDDGILLGENEPQMKRRQVLNDIIRRWYFLGGEERRQVLSQYQVTDEEQQHIEDLSNKIINHRVMLHIPLTGQALVVK